MISALGTVLMLLLLVARVPIAHAMSIVGIGGIYLIGGGRAVDSLMRTIPYSSIIAYGLIVLPLFLAMSEFAAASGVSKMFYAFRRWFGWLPGGEAVASILGAGVFAAICGSSTATAAAVGKIAIPEMRESGYSWKLAIGSVTTAGTLGILIPPSAMFIVYGMLTQVPIAHLFIAGIIPGIAAAALYAAVAVGWAILRPQDAPRSVVRSSWLERFESLKLLARPGILIFVVLGGIYSGLTTTTEAAGLGALVAFLMVLTTPGATFRTVTRSMGAAVSISAIIMLVVLGATIFSKFITMGGLPFLLVDFFKGLGLSSNVIVLMLIFVVIVMGCFLESNAILFLTLPFLTPVLTALNIDLVWFGVLMCIAIEIGLITPPVGFNVYVMKGIFKEVSLGEIFAGSSIFLIGAFAIMALVFLYPPVATALPEAFKAQ
ncbi:TRAP transporter large permease [Alsobacter sp. SYSU M60028]|uniref:TRAP transporter large permease protein n=1 Tax=Alsobacter ponti TaxID=2962936 RepID=A0ABT1L8C2_9HYPH|nr:TRAP transporter large permease [Alsobacter ponti]